MLWLLLGEKQRSVCGWSEMLLLDVERRIQMIIFRFRRVGIITLLKLLFDDWLDVVLGWWSSNSAKARKVASAASGCPAMFTTGTGTVRFEEDFQLLLFFLELTDLVLNALLLLFP